MKYNIKFTKESNWAIINPVMLVSNCFVSWSTRSSYWALILMCSNGVYHHIPLKAVKSITELEQAAKDDELVIKLKDLFGNKYKSYEDALEKL